MDNTFNPDLLIPILAFFLIVIFLSLLGILLLVNSIQSKRIDEVHEKLDYLIGEKNLEPEEEKKNKKRGGVRTG